MKKKLFAVLSAVTVLAMGSMTVSAESPAVGTTSKPVATQNVVIEIEQPKAATTYAAETTASAGYKVEAVTDTTIKAAAVAVQNEILNNVAAIGAKLNDTTLTQNAADPTKKAVATMLSVVEVDPTTATKNASGNYVVTLSVPAVATGDSIVVLHYNESTSTWEVIVPTSVTAGSVTFATASLSPISVVKVSAVNLDGSPVTGQTGSFTALFALGTVGKAVSGR